MAPVVKPFLALIPYAEVLAIFLLCLWVGRVVQGRDGLGAVVVTS